MSRTLAVSVAALSLLACGDEPAPRSETATTATPARAAVLAAESASAAAQDQWSTTEVVKRLTEAGLVVADSGEAGRFAGIEGKGSRLVVSGSELVVYIFSNAAERAAATTSLDTVPPPEGYVARWRERPRVIVVNNLVALHYTPNERLAERVDNVLRARHLGG